MDKTTTIPLLMTVSAIDQVGKKTNITHPKMAI